MAQTAGRDVRFRKSQRRRIGILVALAGVVVASAAVALIAGGGWWELHLLCDLSLALHVALLLEAKRRRRERLTKVRPLGSRPSRGRMPAPQSLGASTGRR